MILKYAAASSKKAPSSFIMRSRALPQKESPTPSRRLKPPTNSSVKQAASEAARFSFAPRFWLMTTLAPALTTENSVSDRLMSWLAEPTAATDASAWKEST